MNHESVEQLLNTLHSIDGRLKKIEKFMLIGHVVVWTVAGITGIFWWLLEHFEYIRSIIRDFVK